MIGCAKKYKIMSERVLKRLDVALKQAQIVDEYIDNVCKDDTGPSLKDEQWVLDYYDKMNEYSLKLNDISVRK